MLGSRRGEQRGKWVWAGEGKVAYLRTDQIGSGLNRPKTKEATGER